MTLHLPAKLTNHHQLIMTKTLFICGSLFLFACSSPTKSIKPVNTKDYLGIDQTLIDSIYSSAVQDALNPEPDEVSFNLKTITTNDTNLTWSEIDGEKYLLVVSYKTTTSYYQNDSTGFYNTGPYDIWVTVAPEMQLLCSCYTFESIDRLRWRLRQLLGLLPDGEQDHFVEFWVRPQDLFRPCPDSEVYDDSCDLCFREDVSRDHRRWFNELRAVQYKEGNKRFTGYPWTQLGYTYDWNPNNKSHIGLSEFVVKKNARVIVGNIKMTAEYCEKSSN